MKTIYIYNCNNKNEFICTKTVQDNLNTLYYATEIAYPETEQGYTRCFNIETNTWSQPIKDYRGKTIYRKDNPTCVLLNTINQFFNKKIDTLILIEKIKVINTKKGDKS